MKNPTKIAWANSGSWGNRIIRKDGYVLVHCPKYPLAYPNGYILEHRLVMAASLGRPLLRSEHVHHKNENSTDNRIENLEITSNSEHLKYHNSLETKEELVERAKYLIAAAAKRKKPRKSVFCACGCGKTFITPDKKGRTHLFIVGHSQRGKTWRWGDGKTR